MADANKLRCINEHIRSSTSYMPCGCDADSSTVFAYADGTAVSICSECDALTFLPPSDDDTVDVDNMKQISEDELKQFIEENKATLLIEQPTKRENGVDWEAKWYAYVPDKNKPSTWKLRLAEIVNGKKKITVRQLGRAAAALSKGGFRGRRVKIPAKDLPSVKARIRKEYKKLGAPIPASVKSSADEMSPSIKEYADIFGISEDEAAEVIYVLFDEDDTEEDTDDDTGEVIREDPEFWGETLCLEKSDDVETLKITGICGAYNKVTANNRVYPISVYIKNRKKLERMIKAGKLLGEIDHPSLFSGGASVERTCVKFTSLTPKTRSGKTVDQMVDDTEPYYIHYEAEIAPTRLGQDLITLIKSGFGIEWSSRGYGGSTLGEWGGKKEVQIIDDDFRLMGFDAVIGAATAGTGVSRYENKDRCEEQNDAGGTSGSPSSNIPKQEVDDMEKNKEENVQTETVPEEPVAAETKTGDEGKTQDIDIESTVRGAIESAVPHIMDKVSSTVESQVKEELNAVEKNKRAVTAKINELCGAEEVPQECREIMRKYISQGETPEEVQERFDAYLPIVKDTIIQVTRTSDEDKPQKGFGIIRRDPDLHTEVIAPTGERRERPHDIEGVIKLASAGLPVDRKSGRVLDSKEEAELKRAGYVGLGLEESPENPRWVFERILYNWAFMTEPSGAIRPRQEARYLAVHTQEGYENFMRNVGYFTEATLTSDFSAGNPQLLPIFRAVFPKLIANDLVTVYPISTPTATVYLMEPQYDSGDNANQNISNTAYATTTFAQHTENTAKSKLKLTMTSATITATEKAIEVVWTEQASQDMRAYFNLDLGSSLVSIASDYIAREINFYVLGEILSGSGLFNVNYGTTTPSNYQSPLEWRKELITAVDRLGAMVASARLQRPDWIVAGNMEVARLSNMTDRWEADTSDVSQTQFGVGLNRVGTFNGRYRVYECDWFNTIGGNNKLLVGLTPQDWNNTGYLYCPYIPLYQTPIQVTTSTNQYSKALGSRFGTRLHHGQCFGTVTIQPGVTTGDPLA